MLPSGIRIGDAGDPKSGTFRKGREEIGGRCPRPLFFSSRVASARFGRSRPGPKCDELISVFEGVFPVGQDRRRVRSMMADVLLWQKFGWPPRSVKRCFGFRKGRRLMALMLHRRR